ncbi:NUDIX domain-containing protein [bacterium]|nr:NUDIX domain-containing protein [bacterium]
MQDRFRFCPRCGGILEQQNREGQLRQVCIVCGEILYHNPIPAVAAVLFQEGRVLLVKRKFEPRKGLWGLPAGFMEWGESPEQALIREVREETNAVCVPRSLLGAESHLADPYGHVLVIGYRAELNSPHHEIKPGDDAEEVAWYELDKIPTLAFHSHQRFLSVALQQSSLQHEQDIE